MALIHTLGGVLGAGAVSAATVLGVTTAEPTPTPDSSATADGSASECRQAPWQALVPEDLRADVKAARALPQGERRPALREVRRDARAGEYGEAVQRFAQLRQERRAERRAALPVELRRDLEAARDLEGEERRAAIGDVRDRALAGAYGEEVQQVAEPRQERREACRG